MDADNFFSAQDSESDPNEVDNADSSNYRQLRKRKVKFDKVAKKKTRKRKEKHTMSNENAGTQNPGNSSNDNNANANANEGNANIFQGLSPNRVERLKDFVSQQVLQAVSSIRVTTVNPKIDMPEYHYERMTSDSFFSKCINYFKSQGYTPTQYHQVVGAIMKGDMKLWHDNVTSSINSWADFCNLFKAKYDSEAVVEKRKRHLYTRRQKFDESVEQFVYEMVNLGKQVNPNETEETSVDRAYEAMSPDIYRAIGDLHIKTVNNLIEQANRAVRAIRASDKLKGTYTRLPPVYGYKKPDDKQGRGRSFSFGSGPPPRRQFQDNLSNFHNPNTQSSQNSQFRQRVNSAPTADMQEKRCFRCREIGHMKRDCPSNVNVATAMTVSTQPQPSTSQGTSYNRQRQFSNPNQGQSTSQGYNNYNRNPRQFSQNTSQNLNFQGGHRPK